MFNDENSTSRPKPATKQVFVSAKYFLISLALDDETVYPVSLSILSPKGSSSYTFYSKDELLDMLSSPYVLESGVVRVLRKPKGTYVDIRQKGRMTIPYTTLPYIRNNTTLVAGQVTELYNTIFGKAV